MIQRLLSIAVLLFPVSEITLGIVKRSRDRGARSDDRGSMRVLWVTIVLAVAVAVVVQDVAWARLPGPAYVSRLLALVLLVGGLVIRWIAILTLGRFFTVDIAIHSDHRVVQSGLYRFVRHPSYTGLLLAFLGLGVHFDNWLSILILMIPITLAVYNRVVKEEAALTASLGSEYGAYCSRTRRFVPGLF